MPARLDLTPEEYLTRSREQNRQRVKRYRERRNAAGNATGVPQRTPGNVTPPHPPPVSSPLSTREIERTLQTFAARGYKHDDRFWELLQAKYPLLDWELELLKLGEWLDEPRNTKRRCTKGFISNWVQKAEQDRREREAAQAPRPARNGLIPPPPPPPPVRTGSTPADLMPIDLADFQRTVAANRARSLPEKLAAMATWRARG